MAALSLPAGCVWLGSGCREHFGRWWLALSPATPWKTPVPLHWGGRAGAQWHQRGAVTLWKGQQEEFHGRAEMSFLSSLEQCKRPS